MWRVLKPYLWPSVVSLSLGGFLAAYLIWKGYVVFDWSEAILAEVRYERSRAQERRILVLGDSQLEEWPLEHCLYRDLLRFARDHEIGMVNAAHGGFGPIEYRDRLAAIGPDYHPDLILIFHYAGNDLTDTFYRRKDAPPKQPSRNATYVVPEQPNTWDQPVESGYLDSLVPEENPPEVPASADFDWQQFVDCGVDAQFIEYAKNCFRYPGKFGPEFINPSLLTVACWKPQYVSDNLTLGSPASRYGWYRTLTEYEALLEQANELGAEVKVVIIPSTAQVDTSHHTFYRKLTFHIEENFAQARQQQDLLLEFARYSGVEVLDLLPAFKQDSASGRLYFLRDDHLNERGHYLAFQQVRQHILEPYLADTSTLQSTHRVDNFSNRYYSWKVEYEMSKLKRRLVN